MLDPIISNIAASEKRPRTGRMANSQKKKFRASKVLRATIALVSACIFSPTKRLSSFLFLRFARWSPADHRYAQTQSGTTEIKIAMKRDEKPHLLKAGGLGTVSETRDWAYKKEQERRDLLVVVGDDILVLLTSGRTDI